MTGLVELVARAILAVENGSWCITPGIETELARAAIAAMREPTEAMVEAGMDKTSWPICNGEVVHRWEAMIDRALCE